MFDLRNVSNATWVRSVALALAIINKLLAIKGVSPLPFESEEVVNLASDIAVFVTAIIAWWKDNAFTDVAIRHNRKMLDEKQNR